MSIEGISAVSGDYGSTTTQDMWQQLYENSIKDTMNQDNASQAQQKQQNANEEQASGDDTTNQSSFN